MVLVSYDISDDKKRARFSKYIKQFGVRLQYSVYQIENSERILQNIMADLNNRFLKTFDESDSVYIFRLTPSCQMIRFGYAKHEDSDFLIVE